MRGRLRAGVLLGAMVSLVTAGALPAAAETTATLADRFGSQSYSGNDGDIAFAGPWTEFGESNGPESGPVYVWSNPHCAGGSGWCLKIGGDEVNIDGHGVAREADTSGATSAVLRYSFRRALFDDYDHGAWVKVQVSGDGGGTWTTVDRHKLNRDDAADKHKQHDITGYAGARMQVRFIGGPADEVQGYIYIDDVEIELAMAPPSTTTTTTTIAPPTTTSPSPTTTSTVSPPSSTTTTTIVAAAAPTTTSPPQPEPVATTAPPASANSTPPEASTTTTTAPQADAGELPVTTAESTEAFSEPGTYESFISKAGLTVTGAMPAYYLPSDDPTGTNGGRTAGTSRTPVERLGVAFSTATETLRNHSVSAVVLGVLVAWLALRGLGRTRRSDER